MLFDESFEEENFFLEHRRKRTEYINTEDSDAEERQTVTQTSSFDDDYIVLTTKASRKE